ncbi:UNVERIFIED_CONTAM: Bicyclogermacrene synthase [Sesamum calycinum]|uniref:Bicyclogermacrene synthase n=1 Tax=Sesamum calycinum TaxID=2727403 RepID=A0AAW2Q7W8_9LAMI
MGKFASSFWNFSEENHDLYSTALSFRLLRQHGYRVSCEIFEKFKDARGEFKVPNIEEVKGVLEFYEATHLRVHGEDVLEHGWWKGIEVEKKLSYARDRMVETYFWILGVYFEPEYAVARKILTRVQALASLVDDTFDAYATFQELQIFTQAIERWSISCLDQLPDYMKIIYKELLEVYEEIEEEMKKQGTEYRVAYGIEAMKVVVRDYLEEVKWREQAYKPTTEEYMRVATRSCAYTSLIIISFLGMPDVASREAFDWVLSQPHIVRAALVICRLTDDMWDTRKRDHVPSSIECYIEEHNVSKQDAVDEFKNRIEAAWKDINEAFLRPTKIPAPLLDRILNFSRVIEVMYSKGDWYTHVGPEMQSFINQLLIEPIPE